MSSIWAHLVIGVRCYKIWDTHPALKKTLFLFRFSFRGTSDLSPFPFSATTQVMENNVFTRRNLTGQLYLVCKNCWIHFRHVSTLCEPCRGCEFFESIGWELWTPGRGRSAWWRHPCWMIIFYIFSNQDVFFFLVTHWILAHFNFRQEWRSLELFRPRSFKGVTPLGHHTRPACN